MSVAVARSEQERVKRVRLQEIDALIQLRRAKLRAIDGLIQLRRATLRQIEAHRTAVKVHTSAAEYFENCGLEAQAAVVRERAEHARMMLEAAFRKAEAIRIYSSEPFARSDSSQHGGRLSK